MPVAGVLLPPDDGEDPMIHIHRWTRWTDVPVLHSSPPFRLPPKRMDGQKRRCERCNRRELRLAQ